MSFPRLPVLAAGLMLLTLLFAATSLRADDSRVEIGVRANVLHVSQTLTDQMLGIGLVWTYHAREDWFVAFALDVYQYDIEQPLGLPDPQQSAAPIKVRTAVFSTALGKKHSIRETGVDWFWSAGIGVGIPSASTVSSVSESGQSYDLHAETGAEIHVSATLGTAYHFSRQWALIAAGRIDYRFVDLQITDRASGETLTVDSLTPAGMFLSLSYRF